MTYSRFSAFHRVASSWNVMGDIVLSFKSPIWQNNLTFDTGWRKDLYVLTDDFGKRRILLRTAALRKETEKELSPVEQWFEILKNMTTFVKRPANIDKRFDPIFETCRQNRLAELEIEQYLKAMISKEEKEEIAEAYKEEGLREGFDKGVEFGLEKGIEKGMEKGKLDVARAMKELRYHVEDICKITGLDKSIVEGL